MPQDKLAFDKQSARSIDADGRLHVAKSNISKAVVNPYYGKEIPNWDELGLDPAKVYKLYRDPEELAKGASTFNNLPVLNKHIPVTSAEPQKQHVIGSIGSDVEFNAPYLQASTCVWDDQAIAAIDEEVQREWSCAYRYDPDMTPGVTPDGEKYDGVMRNIRGNHLALVEVGRAGHDVYVADSDPFHKPQGTTAMQMTKLGKALAVSLAALSPTLAQDSAFAAMVGKANKKTFNKSALKKSLCAMDEDLDVEKADEIIDALIGVEDEPKAIELEKEIIEDEDDDGAKSKHAEIIDYLRKKGFDAEELEAVGDMLTRMDRPFGKDEDVPEMQPVDVDEKVTAAMDSLRKQFRDAEQAKAEVRSVVGDVMGMDSAADIYRFALDHMGIDHAGMPASGLKVLFNATNQVKPKKAPVIAKDAAMTNEKFNLGRFRNA